jgi:hypothetical protein
MPKPKAANPHPRHVLLLYARQFALWRGPALLVAVLTGGLAVWAPGPLAALPVRIPFAGLGILTLIIYIYALLGPRFSYVQCRPEYLLVCTPLYRLAISYSRIRTTRPVPFDPGPVRWSNRHLVEPYLGHTMVAMDLNRYPIKRRWLRLFLMEYLLPKNFVGLQFLVREWMALSLNIEVHRAAWKTHQRDQDREEALTSLTAKRRY